MMAGAARYVYSGIKGEWMWVRVLPATVQKLNAWSAILGFHSEAATCAVVNDGLRSLCNISANMSVS